MALESETISKIKALLKIHPKGLTITQITSQLKMNRNSISKYLEVLLVSGQVESYSYGPSRVFFIAHRLPISSLVSLSSNLMVTLDANNEILFCNESFYNFFSLKQDEIAGCHIIEICRKGLGSDILPSLISDVLARQEENHAARLQKNGETFYFKVRSIKMVFDDGSHGLTILFDDVTREKKDHLELEVKEAQYRGIVEDQTEFIIRFLPEGTLTFINKSYSQYLGKSREDLSEVRYIPGMSDDDRKILLYQMQSLSRDSPVLTNSYRVQISKNQVRWNTWTIRALYNGGELPVEYQAVGRDITENKEASEKIHQHLTQMEFFSRKLQEFMELPPRSDIYYAIGAGLYEILPEAVIAVFSYDARSKIATGRAVFSERARELILRKMGRDLVGIKIPLENDAQLTGFLTTKVSKSYETPRDFFTVWSQHVPADLLTGIENDLNLGKCYAVGLFSQETLVGNIFFTLRKGQDLVIAPLINMYVRAASIALQRHIADGALRESEEKYRTLIEKAREGIIIAQDGCFGFVNTRMTELLGKPAAELEGRPFIDCVWPEDRELVDIRHKMRIQGYDVPDSYDFRVIGPGGRPVWVLISAAKILWQGRAATLNLLTDITDRKLAEDALRESESLYRAVIENIQDGFFRLDRNGNLIMASPSFAKILGYSSVNDCIGHDIAEFSLEPEKKEEYLAEIFAKGSVADYVINLKKKEGTPLFTAMNSHVYYDRNGNIAGVEGVFRDISEAHASAERVHQYIAQIRFLSDKLLSFIAMDPSENIFQKIAADLQSMVPGSLVAVNSFHPDSRTLTLEGISVPGPAKDILDEVLRKGITGSRYIVDDAGCEAFRSGKLHQVTRPLYDLTFKTIPEPVYRRLESELGIGDVYAIGFVRGEKILGNATIFLLPGSAVPDLQLIEMYIQEASIVLQRHIAENAMRRSDEVFLMFARSTTRPVLVLDVNGICKCVSGNFSKVFGYTSDDFRTVGEWLELAFPDPAYREKVVKLWESDRNASSLVGFPSRIFSVRCKNAEIKEAIIFFIPLPFSREFIIFEDISSQKQSLLNTKLLSAIVSSTSDAVIGKDIDGKILSWNPAAEKLYGYPADEILGCNIRQVIPSDKLPEMEEIMDRIRNGNSVSNVETRRLRKDGGIINVAVTISPITDETGLVIGVSTISRSITSDDNEDYSHKSGAVRSAGPEKSTALQYQEGTSRTGGSEGNFPGISEK